MDEKEKDLKVQITAQAWLTSLILKDLDATLENNPAITLKEYVSKKKKQTDIWRKNLNFPIWNTGYLFMLAYAFLVIPKQATEKYHWNINSVELESDLKKIVYDKNRMIRINNEPENKAVIRHIRNSIAHANFETNDEDDEIIFTDWNKNGKKTFSGRIKVEDFKNLLASYSKAYYSKYQEEFLAK